MITSSRHSRFEALFTLYNERWLIRRHFQVFSVKGEVDGGAGLDGIPALYIMNHSSWWDGLLLYAAVRRLSARQHFVMMDEAQLSRFRFFSKLGAFSIDKSTPQGIVVSLRYAEELLRQGHSVWIFPQGDIRHLEERPLHFHAGAAHLLRRLPQAAVLPVTAYYTMGGQQKAEAGLWFGAPIHSAEFAGLDRAAMTEQLRSRLQSQLDEHRRLAIRAAAGEGASGFEPLVSGRSTDERFIMMKRRAGKWREFFGR